MSVDVHEAFFFFIIIIGSVSYCGCAMISDVPGTSLHIPRMPELYTGVTIQTQQLGINPHFTSKRYVGLVHVNSGSKLHLALKIQT